MKRYTFGLNMDTGSSVVAGIGSWRYWRASKVSEDAIGSRSLHKYLIKTSSRVLVTLICTQLALKAARHVFVHSCCGRIRTVAARELAVDEGASDSYERTCVKADMLNTRGLGGVGVAGGGAASPGMLRRRYSVPETIMRKYRLAQQRSEGDSEDGGRWSATGSSGRGACAWCGSRASAARREREHMRKSALLRLWGRAGAPVARACACAACGPGPGPPPVPVGTRSLDASHTELRTSPRRLRSDSPNERLVDCSSTVTKTTVDTAPLSDSSEKLGHATDSRVILSSVDSRQLRIDECSFSDQSDPFTSSPPTMKEYHTRPSTGEFIDGRVSERSVNVENNDSNIVPYTQPLSLQTSPYDILEIVVSETLEVRPITVTKNVSPPVSPPRIAKNQLENSKRVGNIPLDEYVSNMLIESLNSLNDQLESMNASIGSERKLNIVEKEIKVKLQNTGVNTIVHLSPTSNNQIIFGNEELYESNETSDLYKNPRDTYSSNIREEIVSLELNNNLTSAESLQQDQTNETNKKQIITEKFLNVPTETVNRAVLQQIQKLFKDELQHLEPEIHAPEVPLPGVSHIEISNVDVFIDDNGGKFDDKNKTDETENKAFEALGGVGSCNYYQEINHTPVVPRFSAFPHTESMEVNTSSSEDTEILGSECTSLVDSLDDPNSPRSVLLRKSFNNKRTELVRSSIDVLDLLPENMNQTDNIYPKEKAESFFIRIKDDDCNCEKENIVVADHMPETIKQRLYRRHRKRELRMESARRSKVKQLKRDLDSNFIESQKMKKEIEKESIILINALIDEVIIKIAQDEYKCMHIKKRANKLSLTKPDDSLSKKHWKKDNENNNKAVKTNIQTRSHTDDVHVNHQSNEAYVRGRLSLQSPLSPENSPPSRIYQKSEIHDGSKCIEILEILEYVNSSQNSETTNSDENHNLGVKSRKSKIPVPVHEKDQKISKSRTEKGCKSNCTRRTSLLSDERNCKSSHVLANMLLTTFVDTSEGNNSSPQIHPLTRRASVPCEARSRSNSLRFKNVFDIIEEEKSSLSFESTGEDSAYNRRASAPSFSQFDTNKQIDKEEIQKQRQEYKERSSFLKERHFVDTRSAGTSPMLDTCKQINVAAMTSPHRKSASTSPIRMASTASSGAGSLQAAGASRALQSSCPTVPRSPRSHLEEGSNARRKSISTQHEPSRRLRGGHSESDTASSVFRVKRGRKVDGKKRTDLCSVGNTRRSFEDIASIGEQERNKERTKIREILGVEKRRKSEVKAGTQIEKERRRRKEAKEKREEELEEEWSSSESSGSLLCSLAPAWLTARRRRRRAAPSGEWAVTVAGSCPSILPNDVEMRLRFPDRRKVSLSSSTISGQSPHLAHPIQQVLTQHACHHAVACGPSCSRVLGRAEDEGRVRLTLKKEASDSSIVASKSIKKSSELLPDLQTYRASRSKTRSSVKTQRGYSLHCWLPEDDSMPIRPCNGLSVEGSAIVPHRKPRAPSMSERDLTRLSSHSHRTHHLPHLRSYLPTNLRNIVKTGERAGQELGLSLPIQE
ncbi:hypothetical protein KGM_215237 [Danaus plexippus plexippus]|uniref:Uncharacterized protein n=1 Tax=Danaus plexippus plexippus TaxID=278856 RepID=A0A212FBT6_DANPL|nr:hypothetical protein KGM_215237 [Danaus plexippus plexippus]